MVASSISLLLLSRVICYYELRAAKVLAVQILMRLEVDLASLASSNDLHLKLPLCSTTYISTLSSKALARSHVLPTMATKLPFRLAYRSTTHCPRCLNRRAIHTTTRIQAGIAAPPIDLNQLPPPNASNARIVPASPSYFTGLPDSTDNYLTLISLLRRYQTLPTVPPAQAPRVAWRTVTQFRLLVGEPVRASKYHKIIEVLQRLNRIHPSVLPAEVSRTMETYKREVDPYAVQKRPAIIDEDGRAFGVGRRKSSSAKVYLVQGEGEVLVNGKAINNVFGRIHDRESALWALKATGRLDKYNVWALVSGGGVTGQAEAITLGAAKALMVFEPALKPALRRGESSVFCLLRR